PLSFLTHLHHRGILDVLAHIQRTRQIPCREQRALHQRPTHTLQSALRPFADIALHIPGSFHADSSIAFHSRSSVAAPFLARTAHTMSKPHQLPPREMPARDLTLTLAAHCFAANLHSRDFVSSR